MRDSMNEWKERKEWWKRTWKNIDRKTSNTRETSREDVNHASRKLQEKFDVKTNGAEGCLKWCITFFHK